jgi:superfamily I DNA/RNA helicase
MAEATSESQGEERERCLRAILESTAKKKLIVAGPGTGKTFTFGQVIKGNGGDANLVMTFIRKLAEDMEKDLGEHAEVKTFHRYCKKILHEQNGRVELVPYLTKIVERDSDLLDKELSGFDAKFQMLEEDSPELSFYIKRGDYYEVVSFNDSVYRLYRLLRKNPEVLPSFSQIVVDEFQDFNPLEVAFLDELENRGAILISGDDDQAVYDDRGASAEYLREKYRSGVYEIFELPFCSRCPRVIVDAANAIVENASAQGYLEGRIEKRYEPFLGDKEGENERYPHVIIAQCTNVKTLAKYVAAEISRIDPLDIAESYEQGKEYPTVLVVGQKQYLLAVHKYLVSMNSQVFYTPSKESDYDLAEAYKLLLRDERSNLGWRILIELFCDEKEQRRCVLASEDGTPMVDIVDSRFMDGHLRALDIARGFRSGEALSGELESELKRIVGDQLEDLVSAFTKSEDPAAMEIDTTRPTILLTSFKGCKGLSAGHVFIVGANNGSIPTDAENVADIEVSHFIVALTRTRKQCHVVSNRWLYSPKDKDGRWSSSFDRSVFVSWIPAELIEDRGTLKAKDIE